MSTHHHDWTHSNAGLLGSSMWSCTCGATYDGATIKAADLASRRFLIADEDGVELALEVTWGELAADNEPETMEAIADIALNEDTILGMCDRIKRIA